MINAAQVEVRSGGLSSPWAGVTCEEVIHRGGTSMLGGGGECVIVHVVRQAGVPDPVHDRVCGGVLHV